MRALAPAKINWTLEVLGKRPDGYHEIRSVMQTIDLCDELSAEMSDESRFETAGGAPLPEDDLIVRAARALEERTGRALPATIRVDKRIPIASGLGGGSSDAAATLRLLNQLHQIGYSDNDLAPIGAEVGSDVPFFVYGGTALVEGRGERVTPLPDVCPKWLVLLVRPFRPAAKTAAMYARLTDDDFGTSFAADRLLQTLNAGKEIDVQHIVNAFERAAYIAFEGLDQDRDALLAAGAGAACLAGAGPALFALVNDASSASRLAKNLTVSGARALVARTLSKSEVTSITAQPLR